MGFLPLAFDLLAAGCEQECDLVLGQETDPLQDRVQVLVVVARVIASLSSLSFAFGLFRSLNPIQFTVNRLLIATTVRLIGLISAYILCLLVCRSSQQLWLSLQPLQLLCHPLRHLSCPSERVLQRVTRPEVERSGSERSADLERQQRLDLGSPTSTTM